MAVDESASPNAEVLVRFRANEVLGVGTDRRKHCDLDLGKVFRIGDCAVRTRT